MEFTMGNMSSSRVSGNLCEEMLDIIQTEGLSQLCSKKKSANAWDFNTVFGLDTARNECFHTIKKYLVPKIQQGLKTAALKSGPSKYMQQYVACKLANRVMCQLVAQGFNISYNGIIVSDDQKKYSLPKYDKNTLAAIHAEWIHPQGLPEISLDTQDPVERKTLSARLAEKIKEILIISPIDELVSDYIGHFNEKQLQQSKKALLSTGLMAQTASTEHTGKSYSSFDNPPAATSYHGYHKG